MYASEVKLLLRYLVYSCDDSKTYIALSLVNRYCAELAKYYSPLKMREFCKEIKWKFTRGEGEIGTAYVLPNGRILKMGTILGKDERENYPSSYSKIAIHFDIKNSTSAYISEDYISENLRYYVDINGKHCEYFYNNKLYSIEDNYFTIKFVAGPKAGKCEFSCKRCRHCKHFHDFTVIIDIYKFYNIFRHCGVKSAKYLYYDVKHHLKRRKVIHAVIQYARNIKSS